jgi:hypothetical protein
MVSGPSHAFFAGHGEDDGKSEGRGSKVERRPKLENQIRAEKHPSAHALFGFRGSGFFRPSTFGLYGRRHRRPNARPAANQRSRSG